MNGLTILIALTVLSAAWSLRAMYLDMQRQRRRADRLAVRNAELRARLEDAEIDLQLWSEIQQLAARDRHPSNVRVIKAVK